MTLFITAGLRDSGFGLGLAALLGLSSPFAGAQEIGVMGAANPDLTGQAPSAALRLLATGDAVVSNDEITSGPDGLGFTMFRDQTSLTIAPNSQITLDKYVYDPGTGSGDLQLNLLRGAVRVIGGRITKRSDAQVRIPTATIGIRGGAATVEIRGDETARVMLIGGEYAHIVTQKGEFTISRPGGYVVIERDGSIAYSGLPDTIITNEISALFMTPGNGGASPDRARAQAAALAASNSDLEGGTTRAPVSTTGLYQETPGVLDDPLDFTPFRELAQTAMFSDMDRIRGMEPGNMGFVDVGGTGSVQAQLIWRDASDLDLHLILPGGAGEVFYANRTIIFNNGGAIAELDADNLGGVINVGPDRRVENIVVNGRNGGRVPRGTYTFFVDAFSIRNSGGSAYELNTSGDGGRTIASQTGRLRVTGEDSPSVRVQGGRR